MCQLSSRERSQDYPKIYIYSFTSTYMTGQDRITSKSAHVMKHQRTIVCRYHRIADISVSEKKCE